MEIKFGIIGIHPRIMPETKFADNRGLRVREIHDLIDCDLFSGTERLSRQTSDAKWLKQRQFAQVVLSNTTFHFCCCLQYV